MIYRANQDNINPIYPIFDRSTDHLSVVALLEGAVPGVIYTDDPELPRSVFAQVQGRFFLAGQPDESFSQEVQELLSSEIFPQLKKAGKEGFSLYPDRQEWEALVERVILAGLFPIQRMRQYYASHPWDSKMSSILLPGYRLQRVDRSLLDQGHLQNLGELVEEMLSERPSVEAFFENSFGTCLIHGEAIVCWCLSEYNLGARCEVGIATVEGYRKKGLATLTGSAFLVEAQQRGYTEIGWHCYAHNAGSVATARRLGFRKLADYMGYFATFDPTLNQAIHGDIHFENGEDQEALRWFQAAFQTGEAPRWAYVEAAGACARMGEKESAFHYLDEAVHLGMRDVKGLEEFLFLESLHNTPEWKDLIRRIEEQEG